MYYGGRDGKEGGNGKDKEEDEINFTFPKYHYLIAFLLLVFVFAHVTTLEVRGGGKIMEGREERGERRGLGRVVWWLLDLFWSRSI